MLDRLERRSRLCFGAPHGPAVLRDGIEGDQTASVADAAWCRVPQRGDPVGSHAIKRAWGDVEVDGAVALAHECLDIGVVDADAVESRAVDQPDPGVEA